MSKCKCGKTIGQNLVSGAGKLTTCELSAMIYTLMLRMEAATTGQPKIPDDELADMAKLLAQDLVLAAAITAAEITLSRTVPKETIQ